MHKDFSIPVQYKPLLDPLATEAAIMQIKEYFQKQLAVALNLRRVTAPLLVPAGQGINDDLSGVEQPVSFPLPSFAGLRVEIVQSLAKWKRLALAQLGLAAGSGIYTDMNAVRPHEKPDNLHSVYVDQWDWERVISPEQRNLDYLKYMVRQVYRVIRDCETSLFHSYSFLEPQLPEEITFIHAEKLLSLFPGLPAQEREHEICRRHGAVFVIGIGADLPDGRVHDLRAPDYDDWSSDNGAGSGLNGDILVWFPVLQRSLELSSMGIRVDGQALLHQLKLCNCEQRRELYYHRLLLEDRLPLTVGGGIGQSRLCQYFLRKAHIGEVQAGIWPPEMIEDCRRRGLTLF